MLFAVPTLLLFSLVVFLLFRLSPGDPVQLVYGAVSNENPVVAAEQYRNLAVSLGVDKPLFYFSLTTPGQPRDLHNIFPSERRQRLSQLALQTADWPSVRAYDSAVTLLQLTVLERVPDSLPAKSELRLACSNFSKIHLLEHLDSAVVFLQTHAAAIASDELDRAGRAVEQSVAAMHERSRRPSFPYPVLYWYGADNQYHHWLGQFARGDWGVSGQKFPVAAMLKPSLIVTLSLNGVSMLLAFLLAMPLGVWMARHAGKWQDRWVQFLMLMLYTLPVFWLGSVLLLLFSGSRFRLFSGSVLPMWNPLQESFLQWLWQNAAYFILPIMALTLHILAVIAMQMRGGILEIIREDYIRTARAKGAGENRVYLVHAFRNALSPVITVFAGLFPVIFGGALGVEYLFNIPGMGIKTQEAFSGKDFPTLMAILMVSALVTIVGNLIGDMLLALVNPKIRFSEKRG